MQTLITLILTVGIFVSCGKDKSSTSPQHEVQIGQEKLYIINGDTDLLIKGTTKNLNINIPLDNFLDKQLKLVSANFYSEKAPEENSKQTSQYNLDPKEDYVDQNYQIITVSKENDTYTLERQDHNLKLRLNKKEDDFYELDFFDFYDISLTAQNLVHFSLEKSKKEIFSFLFQYVDNERGKVLLRFDFNLMQSNHIKNVVKSDEDIQFLLGKNIAAQIPSKDVTYSLCGQYKQNEINQFKSLIDQWNISALKIKLEVLESFPPFNDLNTNCLYKVDNFTSDQRYAWASPIIDHQTFHIEQCPIFFTALNDQDSFGFTFLHELGHCLGLGHNHDKESIMSYKFEETRVTEFDQKALKLLYPVTNENKQ